MLDSRSLLYFATLAEILHFGRTAEKLNVAQSVISVAIRRLEDSLGTSLLERGGRASVRLTKAGETFLEEARATLARLDRAERIGRLAGRGQAGPLHIGYVFSAAMCGVLPRMLQALHDQFPLLSVRPVQMETPEQLLAIADGRIDMGLVRSRPAYASPIAAQRVHEEPLMLALAATDPLANMVTIFPADLAGQRFIMPHFDESFGLVEHLDHLAREGEFVLQDVQRTADFVTALSLAAGGYGIVLAPRSLGALGFPDVVYREIAGFEDQVALALAWRNTGSPSVIDGVVAAVQRHLRRR
ncbi:LysR substrate-binding domain-containing protein [Sphingomonas sp. TX0543]|uniref:LysR substrate-binding domain-containing protein n=1 Tax=Sphingomonas sp. TX0543 TaxID=3399682 RepID=UPI003AFB474B